jgi:hypothetical protein
VWVCACVGVGVCVDVGVWVCGCAREKDYTFWNKMRETEWVFG